ncbi:hypothetical protein [Desulforhopalus sp. IMCC35007]|uniref:hypothetical protein n=1 Tax=Desulforhopalus sp. IMCC35007 TaxID=2569543 RepID=UPI0010AEC63E|nr:hypothetical protein [Desulforhopalus sp. IMCC35007]TKB07952.1 hypothetical protein FCL48_14955 [Desulforhopalus sp. IMCC35007]
MTTIDKKPNPSDPKIAIVSYFVESLYRVFKVGIYYPVGHVVLDQAASKSIQQLREISANAKNIRLSIDKDELSVSETKIPANHGAAKELHKIFYSLGIVAVEIDRVVGHKEILQFVKSLLNWRMQLETSKTLISFQVDELPSSIRVEQQTFVVDEADIREETKSEDGKQTLDELCHSLLEQGLTPQQTDQCRNLLLTLSRSSAAKRMDIKGFPNATWEDVQDLLYQIVTGAYSMDTGQFRSIAKSDINVISSIFQSLERGLMDTKAKETIQFLVAHLTGRKEVEDDPKRDQHERATKKTLQRYQEEQLSVLDIKKYVYENNIPISVLGQLTAADRSEQLSIFLQLLVTCKDKELLGQIFENIKRIIVTDLTERERDVLIAGIKHLADFGSIELFCRGFNIVIRSLRESQTGRSLDFIVEFWAKMPHATHLLLWPFVVNELVVVGMEEKRQSFFEVLEIASHMHSDGMKSMKLQLEELDGFKNTPLADIYFRTSYIYSYPLFAFLLETSLGDQVALHVLESLKKDPQDQLMQAVAPILDLTKTHHLEFLCNYLMQAHQKEPPLALKMAGGEIILQYLQNITEEEKKNDFLATTIIATSSFYSKGMKDMLEFIVKDKKAVVIPAWPKNCRKAAETALKSLKRISASEFF